MRDVIMFVVGGAVGAATMFVYLGVTRRPKKEEG